VALDRTGKRIAAALLLAVACGVALPAALKVRRASNAIRAYEAGVAAYMLYDVPKARHHFAQVARTYGDLPLGALAELKVAFLAYDEAGDLDEAQRLFEHYLDTHPQTVVHLPQTPQRFEYFGELELVAWYFLGRIADDRGDRAEARRWFERIVRTGSRNPANFIVSETRLILKQADAPGDRP